MMGSSDGRMGIQACFLCNIPLLVGLGFYPIAMFLAIASDS
jgi:hypothetical protein